VVADPGARHPRGVRVTVTFPDPAAGAGRSDDAPGPAHRRLDLEVDEGLPVERLRLHLVRATGWAGWAVTTPTADGVPVDDAHPAGVPPLCHGAHVRPGPAPRPVAALAVAAAWHLAVTTGPDAGTLLVPSGRGMHRVGPHQPLTVRDPAWDGPLLVREAGRSPWRGLAEAGSRFAPRRPPAAQRVLVRVTARPLRARTQPTPTVLVPGVGRGRRHPRAPRAVPSRRWLRWRPGDEVRVGASVLVLRAGDPAAACRTAGVEPRVTPTDRRAAALRLAAPLTSVLTGVLLAATLHQPVLLLTGLVSAPMLLLSPRRTDDAGRAGAEPAPGAPAASHRADHGPAGDEGHAWHDGHATRDGHGRHGARRGPRGTPAPPEARDLPALRLATAATRWHPDDDPPVHVAVEWGAGGCLAVVGERAPVLAAARGLLLGALGTHAEPTVVLLASTPHDWRWLIWGRPCGTGLPGPDDDPTLVVVDDPAAGAGVAQWYAAAAPQHHVLWLARHEGQVPAWCRAVLQVTATSARRQDAGGPWRAVRLVAAHEDVAEEQLRWCAGAARPPRRHGASAAAPAVAGLDACPVGVVLGDLPGVPAPDVASVLRAWQRPGRGLPLPLGRGPGGAAVVLDLVGDGPHALVAGTTGAGKSELLTTLVLGLALSRPPERLAVLLVDFKGGTGLPVVADLPHVVGHLSDLDAVGARRALRGLTAELRRREGLLAAVGARDLAELDPDSPDTPARLVVVIDEFRALVDDLPELVPGLGRLAAQGRSLGVHLLLATQRPAGAVHADLRANVTLRIALRVADGVDSSDVVDVPDAARIPAGRPGLAVLRGAGGSPRAVQVARAAPRSTTPPVRWAPPPVALLGGDARAWTPSTSEGGHDARAWADALASAAVGRRAPSGPWLPELPGRVSVRDVPAGAGLPVAVSDLPDELRRGGVRWDPGAGHLLVLGGPGSGRTTTLLALARAAAAAGHDVHAIGVPASPDAPWRTALAYDDVTSIARLTRARADPRPEGRGAAGLPGAAIGDRAGPAPHRPLLVIDDVDAVLSELGALARGAAADRLTTLWTTAGSPVAVVAGAGIGAATGRLLAGFADRLVLGAPDPSADALAGVPAALAGPRPQPGRAVHLGRDGAALCQVALPDDDAASPWTRGAPLVVPLPDRADRPAGGFPRRDRHGRLLLPVGRGGDLAETCWVDVDRGLLVVGPPGSGRTTAVRAAAHGLVGMGCQVAHVVADGPRAADLADRALAALHHAARAHGPAGSTPGEGPLVLVVDDLDELEIRRPELSDAIVDALGRASGAVVVLAATTTAHAVATFRGPAPALLRTRRLLVLDLVEPGSVDLLGPEGAWLTDPRRRPVGRGALRVGRDVTPVQVWSPPAAAGRHDPP